MGLTRRGWIGAGAALAGAAGSGAWADSGSGAPQTLIIRPVARPEPPQFTILSPGAGRDYGAALVALRDQALQALQAEALPGMTLAVTDADGFAAVLGLGWVDRDNHTPVTAGHRFQIGSISKSFIALAVLALADQDRLDPDAPLERYLPDVPLPVEKIKVAQTLSHVAGLPDDAPLFPRTPNGHLWCGFAPGSRFSYSNTGYKLLGRVIEHVTGETHQRAVKRLVRDKLGLQSMAGVISERRRAEFALGYWPADRTDYGVHLRPRLELASWDEEDNPAGSIGATAAEMAVYLRALLAIGAGRGGPVLSDAAARRFVRPVIAAADFGPGARYACGVALQPVDGQDCLHHTGGMMAFSSSFHADPVAGVACFASVNARSGAYRPRQTTAHAVRLMRAVRAGAPLPPPPDPLAPHRIPDPARWVGRYVSASGDAFALLADGSGLRLDGPAGGALLGSGGPARLLCDHPRYIAYGFDAVTTGGKVSGLWWGDTLYGLGAPPPDTAPAATLRPYAGVYLNRDPWVGGATVLVRGQRLVIEGGGAIGERAGGWWSTDDDPGGVERLRFEAMLNGQFQRLNASGHDLLRITV